MPFNTTSKFCVRAADYDKDGDEDLFIAGRVDPQFYPRPVSSFIYRNDSKAGNIKYTDVTAQVAPSFQKIGLACDALFSDYDNDGWPDLVIAGEWIPITFLHNNKGHWMGIAAIASKMNKDDERHVARAYALTAAFLFAAFISCWDAKYHYSYISL